MSAQSKGYNIKVSAKKIAGQTRVEIYNGNAFKLLDLDVEIRKQGESRSYHIDSIAAKSSWYEGERTKKYLPFQKVGFYEGKPHSIDRSLYDETAGIYKGMPYHAMVWPELDEEKDWNRQLQYTVEGAEVNVSFVARGPRMAFCGHSFTGLWDSAYYYFRELAKMGGWNAQIAYSYWGGTGISGYAGLVPGCEMRAEQCRRLLQSNDYYDFFTVAGNSDEAVETRSGLVGDVEYKQRKTMQQGAFLLHKMAKEKEAATILWVPHAYQYGFFQNMEVKPWREGRVGEFYEKDGKKYLLTLSQEEMAIANDRWYHELAESLGGDVLAAPVSMAYHKVYTAYGEKVNPYLGPGAECGDCGHQNNIGNYISACVYYHLIFGEAVEAENVPVSHTWGMDGGSVTKKQAEWIRETVNEMFGEGEKKIKREQIMEITISKRYLKIPVSYSGEVYHFKLSAGEGEEYSFDAAYAEKAADTVYYADLREFLGQTVSMTIDQPVLLKPEYCDQPEPVKEDPMRPMAHFSAPRGWMNDPNGLCCYEGTYHLFYQHNPYGRTWGNMHWGHAVSKDLFHWEHCQEALLSDGDGVIFSGSALIDYRNASGLKKGQNAPILFYYTRVGKTHDQCLAVSTDGGLTLTKYERPVLPAMTSENRDPKVIFDQARSRYLMALYMEESRYALFVSENLLDWRLLQEIELPGDNECPDIYPLQAEDGGEYWILSGAHDKYYVGIFDEEGYYSPVQEIGQLSYDSEGYAAQTYFYEKGKPVIRFTWDRSNIPGTSYNGSMCFPMEMGLVKRNGTYYLTARPVSYEAGLVKKKTAFEQTDSIRVPLLRRAYEIEIHAGEAAYEINLFGLRLQGDQTGVRCKDKFLPRIGKDHTLRIISDTVSTELYLNDVAITSVAHLSDYAEGEFIVCSEGKLQKVCIKELGL